MTIITETSLEEAARIAEITRRLVGWKSETGTPGEAGFADFFHGLLDEIFYFQAHPEDIRLIDSHGHPMARNLVALVRGKGEQTLVLAGHFDVVSTDNYLDLKHLAYDPDQLKPALIDALSASRRSKQEDRALEDLTGGDFLPGRGMLDMKSGIAAGIACLEWFAANPERRGNLMLMISPDEERDSRGMRSLRDALPKLAAELGVRICGAINLDATSDQGDGAEGRSVYAGTIGKLLPFALVIGGSTHAGYPFEGVSAQAMAAGIVARIEGNAALADRDSTDISPPPIALEAKDLRTVYEVTTPERFWIAFNWLYHAMTADQLFERFCQEVLAGAEQAVTRFSEQSLLFGGMTGKVAGAMPPMPRLLTFSDLKEEARAAGKSFEARFAAEEKRVSAIDNPLTASRQLTEWLATAAGLSGPTIIVGFAGLHYPPSRLDPGRSDDLALKSAIDAVREVLSDDPKRSLSWRPYFQGISDMSFLGQSGSGSNLVAMNTPVPRLIDGPVGDALRFPVVNIGPWGREFHQRLERVHAPYAFGVLPRVLQLIAKNLLG